MDDGESTQTATYLTLLETLDEQNIPVTEARAGLDFVVDDVSCSVLSPLRDSYDDLNDSSLVLRRLTGNTRFCSREMLNKKQNRIC